ncbi:pantetheine-phosphate adenylyltransferase [candidate division KSB1 bacterium]|nr:pantetheine-phosphate adenylyltransferase [candidate division KSB1 bacterium]
MKNAIYPGTFDPITNGHLDIINRARLLFDNITVAVTNNPHKAPLFSIEDRIEMIANAITELKCDNVTIDSFEGLLVDYVRRQGAIAIVRGLRATSDFEFEFQMALANRKLAADVVTVFLMPHERYTYLNSTIVKELSRYGAKIEGFVSSFVARKLKEKMKQK